MACHEENPYAKFFGACNDLKMALDKCFVVSETPARTRSGRNEPMTRERRMPEKMCVRRGCVFFVAPPRHWTTLSHGRRRHRSTGACLCFAIPDPVFAGVRAPPNRNAQNRGDETEPTLRFRQPR